MKIGSVFLTILGLLYSCNLFAQTGSVSGQVLIDNKPVEFAEVVVAGTTLGDVSDAEGKFSISHIPFGTYKIKVQFLGFEESFHEILLSDQSWKIDLDISLQEQIYQLNDIVVTGTRTDKRQTNSPVIVNVVNSQTIKNVQACNLSEGLKFQPGLRVETDCQTCNYTQLRINGLAGGYSQILINGRPIFSPLTGLYGLEQLPTNMIDRIEVVRGGGSSLYGSSAIGGTVNVITKIPKSKSYTIDYNYQSIDSQTSEHNISGNTTLTSTDKNSGISLFANHRERDFYDNNGDNYSELPLIEGSALGASMFYLPKDNQKLEFNISRIHEYRFGGEMIRDQPAYLAEQSEERTHNIWMANVDYQINLNNNSSLITYLGWQNTDREHYTGIIPDEGTIAYSEFLVDPPYGSSDVSTINVGFQLNHRLKNFLGGENILTIGSEYLYDDVLDVIPAYNYLIDQTTQDFGTFLQSDWTIAPELTLLSGIRIDNHNLVENPILSPRASLLYKFKKNTQFRLSYGAGFRAPQAFDTDLHIAFAGGGISRVLLAPNLKQESSSSISASINYDRPMKNWIAGFTIEGFYNRLKDAFYLQPIGQDQFGELFEKRNGDGATVQGLTLEVRGNYNGQVQLEGGLNIQASEFDSPVEYIDGLAGIRDFVRTPNQYGYAILTFTPSDNWNATINYVYTGQMKVPHFAGAPNQTTDEIVTSPSFNDLSIKLGRTFILQNSGTELELYGGVKNIFNAYQDDFDIGKNRDSNFVYGPSLPRTLYVGLKATLGE